MTILLEPAIEARLRERAAREKQDADAMANALLAEALLREDADKVEAFQRALLRFPRLFFGSDGKWHSFSWIAALSPSVMFRK